MHSHVETPGEECTGTEETQPRNNQQPQANPQQAHHRRGPAYPQDPGEADRPHFHLHEPRHRVHHQVQRDQQPAEVPSQQDPHPGPVALGARRTGQAGQDGEWVQSLRWDRAAAEGERVCGGGETERVWAM